MAIKGLFKVIYGLDRRLYQGVRGIRRFVALGCEVSSLGIRV